MSYREVSEKIKEKVSRIDINIEDLCNQLNTSHSTVRQLLKGNAVRLYVFLDFLAEINLELRLNDEVITCHQDMINYANSIKPPKFRSAVSHNTVKRFLQGENVEVIKVFMILESMGIEVRVI